MADAAFLLGLDLGTTRTKAAIVDDRGRVLATASTPTPFATTAAGVEMEVHDLHRAVAAVVADAASRVPRGALAAVGVAGMAESGAPLDSTGGVLAPIIAWNDERGAEVVERIAEHLGPELGLRIGQTLRTVSSVAKMGWLVRNGVSAPARWLGVPELVAYHLTGQQATEHSLAGRTGCFDISGQHWLPEVARVAGFSVDVFPPVLPAGAPVGAVSPAAAVAGLPTGIPVTIAGHDHLAAAEAVGAGDDAVNSVGTAETVLRRLEHLPDLGATLDRRLAVSVRPGGKGWVALASAARSGSLCDAVAAQLGRSPAQLDRLAAGWIAGADDRLAGHGEALLARLRA
ncbi:MAG: FGGY family carbohydrate kinase, partial [Acidimicrobiales bacterium]